ncbi:putative toxin-antitoxin system toxin component, PIN family [Candidatus Micrarchaeota archaeon]|nr:putative toxin-antitoxin system toxin component, PIN family [Candidatus Micrarchaeota archaeon]MBU2476921.1 putative toxin-antitoxin system toxin component, PIN family [Candidatus Micrarchaeota archaeon]
MKLSTKSDKIKVVLDTNIVVSALIAKQGSPAGIFEKLLEGKITCYSCKEIIEELIEVFGRKEITKRTDAKARHFVIENYLKNSVKIQKKSEIKLSEHESDNKFIETAVDAEADYIVSGDQHLLKLKKFMHIKILKPKEFLEVLSKKGS